MKRIAVLMAVYNVAEYLPRCLASLRRQTFSDFIVVAVDDGSTDDSARLLDEAAAADGRLTVVHQSNGGVSAARNRALDEARRLGAGLVTFVDPDDWVDDRYLASLVNGLGDGRMAAVGYQDVSERTPPRAVGETAFADLSAEDFWLGGAGMPSAPWGKLMDLALFDGVAFPVGRVHEDEARMAEIAFGAGRVVFDPAPLYCYWHRESSITRGSNANGWSRRSLDHIEAVRDQIAFFSARDLKRPLAAARQLMVTYCVRAIVEFGRTDLRPLLREQLSALGWPLDPNEEHVRVAYPVRSRVHAVGRRLKRLLTGAGK